jgi:hypothetical protein
MKHPRAIIAIPGALALAAVAACTGTAPAPQKFIPVAVAARSYLHGNPVPPVAGMIAGIVTEQLGDVSWTCPRGRGAMVGNCGYWAGLLLTATGQTVAFTCGQIGPWTFSPARSVSCTSAVSDYGNPGYVPEPGDYIYVPDGLKVTRADDVRIIRNAALDAQDQGVPAQCAVTDWTAVHACEYPSPVTGPTSVVSTVFGSSSP